jgi:protein O-mannosyl-transferase
MKAGNGASRFAAIILSLSFSFEAGGELHYSTLRRMMQSSDPTSPSERPGSTRVKSRVAEFMGDPVILCASLVMVTVALYWPASGFQFVNYDDPDYFVKNAHVRSGLSWGGFFWACGSGDASNWHPLTWLSLMLDVTLFESGGPAGPHFTNILFHAANSVLLFWLLRRLTGAHWRSAFVAGLFALHPLNVESVAWVAERKNVLSTFFWLLTLLAYTRYAQKRSRVEPSPLRYAAPGCRESSGCAAVPALGSRPPTLDYSLALLFFALGLMSKPMLITLPFVLLLLDHWPLGRWQMDSFPDWRGRLPRLLLEKTPFFLLSAASGVLTLLVQQQGEAVQSAGLFPFSVRMGNTFVSYCRYLGKAFWPDNLAVFYPHPGHWPPAMVATAATFVFAASLAIWRLGRRFPFLITGWFWFLGTLIPVIGLVQVGRQAIADRYTYVPLIGIFIIISWGAAEIFARARSARAMAVITAGVVLTACAWHAKAQLGYWQNDGTLFRHALAVTRNNYVAHYNLGIYLAKNGRPKEAMDNYCAAIRFDPSRMDPHLNLGIILESVGQLNEAANEYREAVRLDPNSHAAHFNLGCVLVNLGQRDEAIEQFREVLRLKPGFVLAVQRLRELGIPPPAPVITPPSTPVP